MNSRVNFRIFNKMTKSYLYVNKDNYDDLSNIPKEWIINADGDDEPIYYQNSELIFIDDEDFEVEQYVDMMDMNSNLIFEGDYLYSEFWTPTTYLVKYMEGKFCLCDVNTEEYITDIDMIADSSGCQFKIIGNKNENPK